MTMIRLMPAMIRADSHFSFLVGWESVLNIIEGLFLDVSVPIITLSDFVCALVGFVIPKKQLNNMIISVLYLILTYIPLG